MAIEVFVIDDHPIVNQGINDVFAYNDYGVSVVGSATNVNEALDQIINLEPDVILLDIVMPDINGVECCKRIKTDYPNIKVIAYTGELDTGLLLDIWLEKADAVVLKTSGVEELIKTIKKVMDGQRVIGTNVPEFFTKSNENKKVKIRLTRIETEVLNHLGEGMTRKEVAEKMNRAMDTINFHCRNIFKKFGNQRIHEIVKEAKKARYIK
ncbi:MAG: hypothetical protein DRI84_04875 [Bacteroidetes bacterium]|nr:MAG: hypothetical protein DRI84_04875 [Bacteroidota bacterium]